MDWNLKASAWDLTELDQEAETLLPSLVGSKSLGAHKNIGEFSVDLKLGRLGNFGDRSVAKLTNDLKASTMVSSPGSSRRTRPILNRTQNVSCLVDGCTSDLSKCREYHRRHRVCERHSKTQIVFIRGEEQRFCQQCSRLHSLREFDEVKRSCRKRLDGHNRRRRKPQPESLYMTSGSFPSNYQGTRFLQFSNPHIDATTTAQNPMWLNHRQQLHVVERQSPASSTFSCIYNEGDEQFLPANELKMGKLSIHEVSVSQPILHSIASSESNRGSHKSLSDGLTQSVDSDCALSPLSTHPTQTSGSDLSHLLQPNVSLPVQSLGSGLQYSCSRGMEDEPMDLVTGAGNADVHCNGMFYVGPHKSFQFLGSS